MSKIIVWTALVVFALVLPASAQDHLDVVTRVRRELTARGVIPGGVVNPGQNENPCGIFAITKRVAWELRHEGAGLLEKRSGNNCQGYSMDWVVYQDGRGADIAVGGVFDGIPTDSAPAWNIEVVPDHGPRWRAPMDPEDAPAPPPTQPPPPVVVVPPPPPSVPPLDLSQLATKEDISRLEQQIAAVKEDTGEIRAGMNRILKFTGKYIVPAFAAAAAVWWGKPEE